MATRSRPHQLESLSHLHDWQLENKDQDIRGWKIYDRPDHTLGKIDDLLADRTNERVEAVRLDNGDSIPVERILIGDQAVYLKSMDLTTPFVKCYDR